MSIRGLVLLTVMLAIGVSACAPSARQEAAAEVPEAAKAEGAQSPEGESETSGAEGESIFVLDPELSEAGKARAQTLAHVLGEINVTTIYATPFLRTQHTAQPLADLLGIEVTTAPGSRSHVQQLAETLKNDHQGEVVVVVGHSNTIPPIVNALGAGPFENLTEQEYDDLFVVILTADGRATTLRLRYGTPTP